MTRCGAQLLGFGWLWLAGLTLAACAAAAAAPDAGRPGDAAASSGAAVFVPQWNEAERLAELALASNRVAGVDLWVEAYLRGEPRLERINDLLKRWFNGSTDAFRLACYEAMEQVIATSSRDLPRRDAVALFYMGDVLDRRDSSRAAQCLQQHGPALAATMPFEVARWRHRVAVLDGNAAAARVALTEAVHLKPAFSNSTEYTTARARVFKMGSSMGSPAGLELTPESVAETAARYARGGDVNRLCAYVRDTLRGCGAGAMAVEDDAGLFAGAKAYYRRALAPHAPVYDAWLQEEVAALATYPSRRADAEALARLARLGGGAADGISAVVPSADSTGRVAAAPAPPAPSRLRPFIEMAPGVPEVCQESAAFQRDSPLAPLATLTPLESEVWLANSRLLICLRGGAAAWTYVVPLSQMRHERSGSGPLRAAGLCTPAVVGPMVATRLFLADGSPALVGLRREDGRHLWTWHDRERMPAGPPAAWGGDALVVMTTATPSSAEPGQSAFDGLDIALTVLDAHTGRERFSIPLVEHQTVTTGANAWQIKINPDTFWQIPAPVVEGDRAYVNTSAGLCGVVDLRDEAILWLRKYQRFYEPETATARTPRGAILGARTVLFAPADSNWILLLEKGTGRLLGKRTDLAWTAVAPCGPDAAVVLTRATARVLTLDGLVERGASDLRGLQVLHPVREGCLLADRAGALLCRPDGSLASAATMPDDVHALGCDSGGRWLAAGGPGAQWCGVLAAAETAAAAGILHPQAGVDSVCSMRRLGLRESPGAMPVAVWRHILIGVSPDGRRQWELPTPDEGFAILNRNRVGIVRAGRLWLHDLASGMLMATIPDTGESAIPIQALATTAEGLYVGAFDHERRLRLWFLPRDAGDQRPLRLLAQSKSGALEGVDRISVVPAGGRFLVLARAPWHYHLFQTPRPFADDGVADLVQTNGWGRNDTVLWQAPDGRAAAIGFQRNSRLMVINAAGVSTRSIDLKPAWDYRINSADHLLLSYGTQWNVRFIHPLSGAVLDPGVLKLRAPSALGTRVYALAAGAEKSREFTPYAGDVGSAEAAQPGAPLPAWIGREPSGAGVVQVGDLTAHLVRVGASGDARGPTAAVLWRGDQPAGVARLPAIPEDTGIRFTAGGVVLIGNAWMDAAQWQALLQAPLPVQPCQQAGRGVTPDGFLDEWPADAFFDVPLGRMAVCRTSRNALAFGLELRDSFVVERLATVGLEQRLTVSVIPARDAHFAEGPDAPARAVAIGEAAHGGGDAAVAELNWWASPDGRTCWIEAEVSGLGLPEAHAAGQPGEVMALRLLWGHDPAQPPLNLVAHGGWGPFSFVRVALP